ncbi:MAG TPA: hypothetical protein VFT75_13320 [Nocardioidaceae bacterium]|nr:hypothetical protein [Nocardioidaceae bacterium]
MSAVAVGAALCLLGLAATFQAALALGAPWGRVAYGGRAAAEDGRLPGRLRVASGCTVLVLAGAAWALQADITPAKWTLTALFAVNTAANLTGAHPVERWVMSAGTLALTAAFLMLSLT